MRTLILRNTTPQVQTLALREVSARLHTISVIGHGQVDVDIFQVTHDVRSKVSKGIFKAFDAESGEKVDLPDVEPVAEEVAEDSSVVNTANTPPAPDAPKTQDHAAEVFKCETCGEEFDTKRKLTNHEKSHQEQ